MRDHTILAALLSNYFLPAGKFTHDTCNRSLDDCILTCLTNRKFRRTKIDHESLQDASKKIAKAVRNEQPISLSIPFGAYKNWKLPSFPFPDWAEVFSLSYLVSYVYPISQIYSPGVVLTFTYTSSVMERVSNMPTESQVTYTQSLQHLIDVLKRKIPKNIDIRLLDIRYLYRPNELEFELQKNFEENQNTWPQKYPQEVRDKKYRSALNNMQLNGIEDLTILSDDELSQRYLDAAMWCDALDCLEKRRGYNKYGDAIQLVFVRGPKLSIHIGSCRSSSMHFWIGTGIIERRSNRFVERIISSQQFREYLDRGVLKEILVDRSISQGMPFLDKVFLIED